MNPTPLPYKILALAPFAPMLEERFKPWFVQVDLYSMDEAIEKLSPVLYLPLPVDQCPEGAVTLKFKSIKEFKPASILKNYLQPAFRIKEKASPPVMPGKDERPVSPIDDILSMVATPDSSLESTGRHDAGDGSAMLKEIFSNPDFQKTESAWRGLQTLIKKAEIKGFEKIQVSISSVSHKCLETVLDAIEALPYDEIPNLVLIDLGFDNTQPSIENLEKIIGFADRMLLPVCLWIRPEFFSIENWNRLHKIQYIKHHLDDMAYAKFRKLKTLSGAPWLMVLANSFAVRPAHEYEDAPLFVSPVWGLGTLCAESVTDSGWPMGFTKYNRYKLNDLALSVCDETNTASTQALFSDDRIMQMVEAGITPIAGSKNKDIAFIPREASLSGDSIKFQMFINRVIESLLHLREKTVSDEPEDDIRAALTHLFTQTGHPGPSNIEVIKSGKASAEEKIFHISFVPPETVLLNSGKIEFTFAWQP